MRVLGVDCGSRVTGYGVIELDGAACRYVDCGAVRLEGAGPLAGRLHALHRALGGLIREQRPDAAVFETVFHAANASSALKLGHARGVAMLAAAEAALPVYEYSPLEIKSAVVGYGHAEKSQVQQMVRCLLRLPQAPEPYDASDALAVAICHAHSHRYRQATAT